MWPISHSHDLFCFHLHLCMVPSLGPPVPEQLEAGGIFKSLQPKHILRNVGGGGCWPWESSCLCLCTAVCSKSLEEKLFCVQMHYFFRS